MNVTLAGRVANRFLVGDVIGDPKVQLRQFQALVENWTRYEEAVTKALPRLQELSAGEEPSPSMEQYRAIQENVLGEARDIVSEFRVATRYHKIQHVAEPLFWAILQQYVLPPQVLRGVEAASRFWSKKKLSIRPRSRYGTYGFYVENIEGYLKFCAEMRKQVTIAQSAIVKGKLNSDPSIAETVRFRVGSFTVVNTGGFDDKTMTKAVEIVREAERAMRGIGLSKVCYGDILISKTVNNNKRVVAFYVKANDEMFVRANVEADLDSIKTVCHELTHRYVAKFIPDRMGEIKSIYRSLKTESWRTEEIPDELLPKEGVAVEIKGKRLIVKRVEKWSDKIRLVEEGGNDPNLYYTIPLGVWLKNNGSEPHQRPGFVGFITQYASTDPEENFCEMVSYYATGKLPSKQVGMILPLLA